MASRAHSIAIKDLQDRVSALENLVRRLQDELATSKSRRGATGQARSATSSKSRSAPKSKAA